MKPEWQSWLQYIPIGFFFGIGMSVASTVVGWLGMTLNFKKK